MVLLFACDLYDWSLQLSMAGPESARMGCYFFIHCTACYFCLWLLQLVVPVGSSCFGLLYRYYNQVIWFSACSCLKWIILLLTNSETCVEETIGVIGGSKEILCGKACKNLVGLGVARESPRVRTLLMRYMAWILEWHHRGSL